MEIEVLKNVYDAAGLTMVLSVKVAYGEPLQPIPGFPDEQMPPPDFQLLKAVLGREISLRFWGRNAPPLPIHSIVQKSFRRVPICLISNGISVAPVNQSFR